MISIWPKTLVRLSSLLALLLWYSIVTANPVWVDVRSSQEHAVDNIAGDIRISHTEIVREISKLYPDKSTELNLYCRSGNRAGIALRALKNAGYKHVINAGSIEEARAERQLD